MTLSHIACFLITDIFRNHTSQYWNELRWLAQDWLDGEAWSVPYAPLRAKRTDAADDDDNNDDDDVRIGRICIWQT